MWTFDKECQLDQTKKKKKKKKEAGANWVAHLVKHQLLILLQVMISVSWDWAP